MFFKARYKFYLALFNNSLLLLYLQLSDQHKPNIFFSCAHFSQKISGSSWQLVVVFPLLCHLLDTAGAVRPVHGTSYISQTAQPFNALDHVCFPGYSRKQVGSRRSISDVCLTQVRKQEACIWMLIQELHRALYEMLVLGFSSGADACTLYCGITHLQPDMPSRIQILTKPKLWELLELGTQLD